MRRDARDEARRCQTIRYELKVLRIPMCDARSAKDTMDERRQTRYQTWGMFEWRYARRRIGTAPHPLSPPLLLLILLLIAAARC